MRGETVLRTDLPDHRRATDAELLAALGRRDPLALAEAYHRTIPAAHAVARRLLSSSAEVEAVLRDVYSQLWTSPPDGVALEAWVRSRCFTTAADDLRERDAAPASPSLTAVLPELPRAEARYLDAAERALAELGDAERRVLLAAHDKGVPTDEQDAADAGEALAAALLALAGPEPGAGSVDPRLCADLPRLGDWVLGLLPPERADEVADQVAQRSECSALAKALRRGRRRLEGLPPTPDMGQRVLVVVLAGAPAPVPAAAPAPGAVAPGDGTQQITSALDAGAILDPVAPPSGPGSQLLSDVDTGEIPTHAGAPADNPYAELAALDEAGHPLDAGPPPDAATGPDGTAAFAPHDPDEDADVARRPRRSLGSRVVVWLLAAVFMIAGVAAGLYLGLTLLS
jgi:DNA-directed RNA polymerase specialized sigma24 family protein